MDECARGSEGTAKQVLPEIRWGRGRRLFEKRISFTGKHGLSSIYDGRIFGIDRSFRNTVPRVYDCILAALCDCSVGIVIVSSRNYQFSSVLVVGVPG